MVLVSEMLLALLYMQQLQLEHGQMHGSYPPGHLRLIICNLSA
jgi:hypothetical protein